MLGVSSIGKVVYYSSPSYGNIYPVVNMLRALIDKGENVIFYAVEKYKRIVESCGAKYRSYPPAFPSVEYAGKIENQFDFLEFLFMTGSNILETTNNIIEPLRQEISEISPDYIIHDAYAHWGKRISSEYGIRAVSVIPNYPVVKEMLDDQDAVKFIFGEKAENVIDIQKKIKRLEAFLSSKYRTNIVNLFDFVINEEELNLSIAIKENILFRHLYKDTFRFIGISPRQEVLSSELSSIINGAKKTGKKIIYISRGTVLTNDVNYYRECINKVDTEKYEVIVSVGNSVDRSHFSERCGVHLFKSVEQNALLKHVDLFITHGGHNSINEALYHGVPVIVHPLANDQFMCSKMIEKTGVGISISSTEGLSEKINYVLNSQQIRDNVKKRKEDYQVYNAEKTFVESVMKI